MLLLGKGSSDSLSWRLSCKFLFLPLLFLTSCQQASDEDAAALSTDKLGAFNHPALNSENDTSEAKSSPAMAGLLVPKFEIVDLDGQPVSLEKYQGKTVMLNFWALWCTPCLAEMPSLERLYKKLGSKGLEIVAISIDEKEALERIDSFRNKNSLSFSVLQTSEKSLDKLLGLTGVPETFFIGPDGKFLNFLDPESSSNAPRVVGERPWDSLEYIGALERLLARVS